MGAFLYFSVIILSLFYILLLKNDKKESLLKLYVFSIPFFGLMYDVGISFTIDRFFSLLMLFFMLNDKYAYKVNRKLLPFLLFIFYSFMITLVLSQMLPDTTIFFSPLRGKYRYLVQIVFWSLQFVVILFIVKYLKNMEHIVMLLKTLVFSCFILSLIGLFQYFFYYRFGYDILPIGVLEEQEKQRTGMFIYEGLNIFRVSSLGGEPKHFAYSLSIILPIAFILSNLKIVKFRLTFMLIMFVNLILTFSTQGYILFVLNMFIVFILLLYFRGLRNKMFVYFLIFTISVVIFIMSNPFILQPIKLRTIDRLLGLDPTTIGEYGFLEDWNEAVISFLKENPIWIITGVGLGNIHLYAQEYIPYYAYYMVGNVFVAKSGFLRLLSEVGLIGLFLFLLAYLKPLMVLSKLAKKDDLALVLVIISVYSLVDFALTADGPGYIFLFLGVLYCLSINYSSFSHAKGELI